MKTNNKKSMKKILLIAIILLLLIVASGIFMLLKTRNTNTGNVISGNVVEENESYGEETNYIENYPEIFAYYYACNDVRCGDRFQLNESNAVIYAESFSENVTFSGTITFPAGNVQILEFVNDSASFDFQGLGTYLLNLVASKPGANDSIDSFEINVVDIILPSVDALFMTCKDSSCENIDYRFLLGESVYIERIGDENALSQGILYKPDNSTQTLSFSNGKAVLGNLELGEYYAEITSLKPGYEDSEDYVFFDILDEIPIERNIYALSCLNADCYDERSFFTIEPENYIIVVIKAFLDEESLGALITGNVTLPDNSSQEIGFNDDNYATIDAFQEGDYAYNIKVEKQGLDDYYIQGFFSVGKKEAEAEYYLCADENCSSLSYVFLPGNAYLRAYSDASITGNLTKPDGSSQEIEINDGEAVIHLSQQGRYSLELKASKPGYDDSYEYISIIVPGNSLPAMNIQFSMCKSMSCSINIPNLVNSSMFIKAEGEIWDAYFTGNVTLPDNSSQEIIFDGEKASFNLSYEGSYKFFLKASKPGYDDYIQEFEVSAYNLNESISASSKAINRDAYFWLCSGNCEEKRILFEAGESDYIKAFSYENLSLSGNLYYGNNAYELEFSQGMSQLPVLNIGDYVAEIIASDDEENYTSYLEFEVVQDIPDPEPLVSLIDLKGMLYVTGAPDDRNQSNFIELEILYNNSQLYLRNVTSDENGSFSIRLPEGRITALTAKPKSYLRKVINTVWDFNSSNNSIDFNSGASFKAGDFNNDNKVNYVDFGHFSGCFGADTNSSYWDFCSDADFDRNGEIFYSEWGRFKNNYNKQGDASLTSMPGVVLVGNVIGSGSLSGWKIALWVVIGLLVVLAVVMIKKNRILKRK